MASPSKAMDLFDYYTFDHDKHMFSGRSGKQRSKREVAVHTNRFDPNGHSRKISTKIRNTEKNSQQRQSKPQSQRSQPAATPMVAAFA